MLLKCIAYLAVVLAERAWIPAQHIPVPLHYPNRNKRIIGIGLAFRYLTLPRLV